MQDAFLGCTRSFPWAHNTVPDPSWGTQDTAHEASVSLGMTCYLAAMNKTPLSDLLDTTQRRIGSPIRDKIWGCVRYCA